MRQHHMLRHDDHVCCQAKPRGADTVTRCLPSTAASCCQHFMLRHDCPRLRHNCLASPCSCDHAVRLVTPCHNDSIHLACSTRITHHVSPSWSQVGCRDKIESSMVVAQGTCGSPPGALVQQTQLACSSRVASWDLGALNGTGDLWHCGLDSLAGLM